MGVRLRSSNHVKGVIILGNVCEWRFGEGLPEINTASPMTFYFIEDDGDGGFRARAEEYFDRLMARWNASLEELG